MVGYDKALDKLKDAKDALDAKRNDPNVDQDELDDELISYDPEVNKDDFWVNMGKAPLTPEAVDKIQKKLEDLQEKGIDIHEFEDGPLYKNYMDENGFVNPDYSPIAILDKVNDPKEKEELLSEHSDSITPMELNHFLDHIDSLYKEKKERWADIDDKENLARWLISFKMPAFVDMKEEEMGVVDFAESMKNIYRDNRADYDPTVFRQASDFYANPDNQNAIKWVNDTAKRLTTSQSQLVLVDARDSINALGEKEIECINSFRHMLHEMKTNFNMPKAIKLGDDKSPQWVEEFKEGDNVAADRINKRELDALDTCYEMLKGAMSPKKNSAEYKQIMTDIVKAQKILKNKDLDADTMKQQYQEAVGNIIGDIGNYYAHKAVKGETAFSTEHKYKALFRVEKLMKSRYDGLSPKQNAFEADFNTGGAFSINDDEIDNEIVGDEYAKLATKSKVNSLVKKKEKRMEEKKNAPLKSANNMKKDAPNAENTIKRNNSFKKK